MNRDLIIERIELLKNHFKKDPRILCFLGLGSLANFNRLDDYSDLDFFLIVEDGEKLHFLNDLSWLLVQSLVYQFRNTIDGYKAMYHDGIFLEFAVFEKEELKHIPFSPGKIIYKKDDFDESIIYKELKPKDRCDVSFRVGEALTNLYIGLLRDLRGEKASAFSFIQVYAMHQIFELMPVFYPENSQIEKDYFVSERRIEVRFKEKHAIFSHMMQGYDKNKESALAILSFLKEHTEVSKALEDKILELINRKDVKK